VADHSNVICVEVKEQIDHCIGDNRKMSVDKIMCEMGISHGKKRYKNVLRANQKYFNLMESGNLGPLD
jgi:hypothetical protein